MERFWALVLVGLLVFGCTAPGNPTASSASPAVSASPSPSINAEEAASVQLAIDQASQTVPVSSGFLSELAGVTPSAPSTYSMESKGSFSLALSLAPISQLRFADADFTTALKDIANAAQYDKTVSVSSTSFILTWTSQDSQGNELKKIKVDLEKNGGSSICIVDASKRSAQVKAGGQLNFQDYAVQDVKEGNAIQLHVDDSIHADNDVLIKIAGIDDGKWVNAKGPVVNLYAWDKNGIVTQSPYLTVGQTYSIYGVDLVISSIDIASQKHSVQLGITSAASSLKPAIKPSAIAPSIGSIATIGPSSNTPKPTETPSATPLAPTRGASASGENYHIGDSIDAGNGITLNVKDIGPGPKGTQVTLDTINYNGVDIGTRTFTQGQTFGTNGVTVSINTVSYTVGQTPSVQLSISAAATATPQSTPVPSGWNCVNPTQGQVKQLWSALQGNAVNDALSLIMPGTALKDLLKVQKTDVLSYAGRSCSGYNVSLSANGISQLNQLGGAKLSDLSGTFCLDAQYGFPLQTDIKSSLASLSEDVVNFSVIPLPTAKPEAVGLQQCSTPFVIDSFKIVTRTNRLSPVSCFKSDWHDENGKDTGELASGGPLSGSVQAQFQLPPQASNPLVYLDSILPAECNHVSVEGKPVFNNDDIPACRMDPNPDQKNAPCPGYANLKTNEVGKKVDVAAASGTVNLGYSWKAFSESYFGQLEPGFTFNPNNDSPNIIPDWTNPNIGPHPKVDFLTNLNLSRKPNDVQTPVGARLTGYVQYQAPKCAYRFVWPSSEIGALYNSTFESAINAPGYTDQYLGAFSFNNADGSDKCFTDTRRMMKPGDCVRVGDAKEPTDEYLYLGNKVYTDPYGGGIITFLERGQDLKGYTDEYSMPVSLIESDQWFDLFGPGFKQMHVLGLLQDENGTATLNVEFLSSPSAESVAKPSAQPVLSPTPSATPISTSVPACKNTAASCGFNGVCNVCASGQFCQNQVCQTAQTTALIVSDASISYDNATNRTKTSLNAEEQATVNLLQGYPEKDVSYVAASQATYESLSNFKAVVATDYYPNSPFNADAVGKLEANGKKIVLLRDAIGFGNDGADLGDQSNFDVTISKNEGFLSNYDTWQNEDYYPNVHVQDGGKSYQNRGMLTNLASSDHCCNRVSTFYANSSAGGRIAAWGYDPAQLSSEGKVMADEIFRWAFDIDTPGDAVPSGSAALVTADYNFDGKPQPSLTAQETALKALLEAEGQKVYLVPQSHRFNEDYRGASVVASASFPGLRLTGLYNGLTTKKPGIFMQDAVLMFSHFSNAASDPLVQVTGANGGLQGQGFLANYDSAADHNGYLALNIQSSNAKGYCRNNLGGWTQISQVPASQGCGYGGTMFSRQANGVNSILIGHDPSVLNDEGNVLFDEAYRWALNDHHYALSVPAGNVGLLIDDFNNAAVLTANESALQSHLQSLGYKVTAVPEANRFKTDFTQAAFLAAIEDGIWNRYSFSASLGALGSYAPRAVFIGPAIGLATDGRQAAEDTRNPAGGHPWEGMHLDFGYNGQLGHDVVTEIGPQSSGIYTKSSWHFGGQWKGVAQQFTCCNAYTVWTASPSTHAGGLLFGYTFTQLNTDGLKYLDARMADVAAKR